MPQDQATGAPEPRDAETYARLIRMLSDPGSGPHADNLVTNEDSFPRPCGELAASVPPGSVYLGVGPDQNFTYVAHTRPSWAFVLDFRRRNLLLHAVHRALFALSDDRVAYLERLTARRLPPPRPGPDASAEDLVAAFEAAAFERARLEEAIVEAARYLEPLGVVEDGEWPEPARIQTRLAGPGMQARFLALPTYPTFGRLIRTTDRSGAPAHLLAVEDLYRRVRDLQRAGRIVPIVGDFAGGGALPRLADWLDARGLRVGLLYISDVEFFLLRDGRFDAYVANLRRLPWAEGARIVRTSTRPIDHPERLDGDATTTITRRVDQFLEAVAAGRVRTHDDLFGL